MNLLTYKGDGGSLFKLYIVNILLSVITLGIYYPWAKAKLLAYHYSETEMHGSRFAFLGTGKEMFIGFLKALLIFGVWYLLFIYFLFQVQLGNSIGFHTSMMFVMYIVLLLIIPLAIVGSLKYRFSRTTWRGIHMKYTGTVKSMYKVILLGFLYTVLTFGIYSIWLMIDIRKEITKNIKLGTLEFSFEGRGSKLFGISFFGYLLSIITLGIYSFQWMANLHNFYINGMRARIDFEKGSFKGTTTGLGFFKLLIGNFFIVLLTLGLGAPYALVRSLKYYTSSVELSGNINFDEIKQVEINESDATGEGFLDAIDLNIV